MPEDLEKIAKCVKESKTCFFAGMDIQNSVELLDMVVHEIKREGKREELSTAVTLTEEIIDTVKAAEDTCCVNATIGDIARKLKRAVEDDNLAETARLLRDLKVGFWAEQFKLKYE